jgi:glycosyltransferase involved in cell wall biosynthesis
MIWQLIDGRSIGGIERHVATLVSALRMRGGEAEVVLWRRYAESEWVRQLEATGIPYRALDGTVRDLCRQLQIARPSLVHTHGYKAGIVGRTVAKMLSIPVISTFHAGERGAFPVSLYVTADALLSFLAPRIAVSQAIAERLPWGAEVIDNFLVVPERTSLKEKPLAVGFIGRLSHEKGPDLFCEIAARCGPGIAWHVWGDGRMRAELEAKFGAQVVFHGSTLDVNEALASIGLLLMPSRAEGLPMAALEAMAAGIPVAASRVGALPSLISSGESGWLFDAGDVAAACDAVGRWWGLGGEERMRMGSAAHATVRARYSDHVVVPRLLELYRVAGLKGRPAELGLPRGAKAEGSSVS